MDISGIIPVNRQEDVNPISGWDYTEKNGIVHCGVCGKAKQFRFRSEKLGVDQLVPCLCDCKKKELDDERAMMEKQRREMHIGRLREFSLMSNEFTAANFSRYCIQDGNQKGHKIALNYVRRFQDMEKENQGLVFYGPVGTGKSYTAACIANALLEKQVPVVMTSFVEILKHIQGNSFDEETYLSRINMARLLIIDDLGAERNTDYALEKVYNVIDSRVRSNRPMILTTNLTMDEMTSPQDIRYSRIYDRILKCCYPVEISGKSFRMKEAAARYDRMSKLVE